MNVRLTSSFRPILTVSEITREIRDLLELTFEEVWVEGEISNLRVPPSGHVYFTLKDESSQIRAVLFKMQGRFLRFSPEDGLQVICRARLSLYEKRGEYQLVVQEMEPKGLGALQLALVQLKERLEREGLFDAARKKSIPMVPRKIGIITSPTGAVIRDMLHIFGRRFENYHVLLYPVPVQGEEAPPEIVKAIRYFNESTDADVIILGRGGGSLEDLWAFNEEAVARAIYASEIPIISAVGHETDYTIADFVADLRAPTPSAAAELAIRDKGEIQRTIRSLEDRVRRCTVNALQRFQIHLFHLRERLPGPAREVQDFCQRVEGLSGRISLAVSRCLRRQRERLLYLRGSLFLHSPTGEVERLRGSVSRAASGLERGARHCLQARRERLAGLCGKLASLSPLAILERGYSITRTLPSLEILKEADKAPEGSRVEVRLHRGLLVCEVQKVIPPDATGTGGPPSGTLNGGS